MIKGILMGLMMTVFTTSGAWAEGNQQNLMKTCNADAKKQSLKGDARKTFMKTCLSGPETSAPAVQAPAASPTKSDSTTPVSTEKKPMTKQQQRMKDCNAEAKSKEMKGDPRKAFMKTCLSNKK